MIKIFIKIDKERYKLLQTFSKLNKMSISELINKCIDKYINQIEEVHNEQKTKEES